MKKLLALLLIIPNLLLAQTPLQEVKALNPTGWWKSYYQPTVTSTYGISAIKDFSGNNYHFTQATAINQAVPTHYGAPPEAPLVHLWMEDNLGTTAVINSGTSGVNGVANRNTNLWSTASGKINRGFDFYNGSTADKVDLGADVIAANGAFTFCTWLKWDGKGGVSFGRVAVSAADSGIQLNSVDNKISILGVSTTDDYYTTTGLQHLCVSRNASASSGAFFWNGILGQPFTGLSTAAQFRYIGNRAADDRYHDGLMDDLRIYSRALTASEIAALYYQGVGKHVVRPPINGLPAAAFDGVQNYYTSTATLGGLVAADNAVIFMLMRVNKLNSYQTIFIGNTKLYIQVHNAENKVRIINDDGSVDIAYTPAITDTSIPYIFTFRHTGGQLSAKLNNVLGTSLASGNTASLAGPTTLGTYNTQYSNADIVEFITFNTDLTPAQEQTVYDYLTWIQSNPHKMIEVRP